MTCYYKLDCKQEGAVKKRWCDNSLKEITDSNISRQSRALETRDDTHAWALERVFCRERNGRNRTILLQDKNIP